MGRAVRRVPPDWQHPREGDRWKPLHAGDGAARLAQWLEEWRLWQRGEHPDQSHTEASTTFTEWNGEPPNPDDFMPPWPPEVCTHYQMYETTSEGTPISPPLESPEALARWLADNGASAFGDMTASYEQWLATIRRGSAVLAVTDGGRLVSGGAAEV